MSGLETVKAWMDAEKLSQEAGHQICRWLTEPEYADFVDDIQTLIETPVGRR